MKKAKWANATVLFGTWLMLDNQMNMVWKCFTIAGRGSEGKTSMLASNQISMYSIQMSLA